MIKMMAGYIDRSRMQLNSYRTNAADQENWCDNAIQRSDQSEKNDGECKRWCIDFVDERSKDFSLLIRLLEHKHQNSFHIQDEIQDVREKRHKSDGQTACF